MDDRALIDAVRRAEDGIVDADLGGGVVKQRIARRNEGKSGGFRSIILLRIGARAFFVYGFAKNARENIRADELDGFKLLAEAMLNYRDDALAQALERGALTEVADDKQDLSK